MNKGDSTGGRPRYEPDKEDLELAKKLASTGLSDENVSKMLGISKNTYYALMERDEDFLHRIRRGRAYYYLKCDEAAVKGEMSATMYVFFAKTKWKHFYPQEDREVQPQKVEFNLTDEQTMKILEIAEGGNVQHMEVS